MEFYATLLRLLLPVRLLLVVAIDLFVSGVSCEAIDQSVWRVRAWNNRRVQTGRFHFNSDLSIALFIRGLLLKH